MAGSTIHLSPSRLHTITEVCDQDKEVCKIKDREVTGQGGIELVDCLPQNAPGHSLSQTVIRRILVQETRS